MRKPARRRTNQFDLPGLPGLESRRLLSADFPMSYAEVAEPHRPDAPMRFEDGPAFDMLPKLEMVSMRGEFAADVRMGDSMAVRPAFDGFRQMPGGPDRFATTMGDSVSVKFGTPVSSYSPSLSSSGPANSTWLTPAENETSSHITAVRSGESESPFVMEFSTFAMPFRVPLTIRINLSTQASANSSPKVDRIGPVPLILPSAPTAFLPVAPDSQPDSPTVVTANQTNSTEKSGKSNVEANRPPLRTQPSDVSGETGPSNRLAQQAAENERSPFTPIYEETRYVRSRESTLNLGRFESPEGLRHDATVQESVAKSDTQEKQRQPAVWSRISEAFGIDDTEFGSIDGEPLEEPVEIDTDELSAAVDRIIEGFALPVEDPFTGPQLGKSIGMAAGVVIAIQIYTRRRRFHEESNRDGKTDRAEDMTHVSPQLDQLDESDR